MATKPIPVRFDPMMIARLDRAAVRLGTNRAALIKMCAQTFVNDFEAHGGIASLPPNWTELLHRLDGRRSQVIRISGNNDGSLSQSMAAEKPSRYRVKKKGTK